jgi:hypothetical protein
LAARSTPVSFKLEKLNINSIAIGVDEGLIPKRQIPAAWLHQGEKQRHLYSAVFTEDRPDLAEVGSPTATYLQDVGAEATDLLVPWTNYDRSESFHHWFVWREGSRIYARALPAKESVFLDLGRTPESFVRAALIPPSGELDLLILTGAGRELLLARFPAPSAQGVPEPGRVLWRLPLPWVPLGARIALAPRSMVHTSRAVLISQDADSLLFSLLDTSKADRPGELKSLRVQGVQALAHSEPGLWIDDSGNTHAAVLCEKQPEDAKGKDRSLALATLTFNSDGTIIEPVSLTELARLPTTVKSATVRFAMVDGESRLGWAALLENGLVIHPHSGGQAMNLGIQPAVPLELLARSQALYLLTVSFAEGPRLITLH